MWGLRFELMAEQCCMSTLRAADHSRAPESPAKNAVFRLYSALYGAIHKKLFHVKHFAFAAYLTDYGLLAALSAADCFT